MTGFKEWPGSLSKAVVNCHFWPELTISSGINMVARVNSGCCRSGFCQNCPKMTLISVIFSCFMAKLPF